MLVDMNVGHLAFRLRPVASTKSIGVSAQKEAADGTSWERNVVQRYRGVNSNESHYRVGRSGRK